MLKRLTDRISSAKEKFIPKSRPSPEKEQFHCVKLQMMLSSENTVHGLGLSSHETITLINCIRKILVKRLVKKEKREMEKEIAHTSKSNPKNFWKL